MDLRPRTESERKRREEKGKRKREKGSLFTGAFSPLVAIVKGRLLPG